MQGHELCSFRTRLVGEVSNDLCERDHGWDLYRHSHSMRPGCLQNVDDVSPVLLTGREDIQAVVD